MEQRWRSSVIDCGVLLFTWGLADDKHSDKQAVTGSGEGHKEQDIKATLLARGRGSMSFTGVQTAVTGNPKPGQPPPTLWT